MEVPGPGDVLLAVNGSAVKDSSGLLNLIAALKPDDTAHLTVARKNQSLELQTMVARPPAQRPMAPEPEPEN